MNVLILGSGAREHAFAWKIAQSSRCNKLFIAPGNAGTKQVGTNININVNDFESIKKFVIKREINDSYPIAWNISFSLGAFCR